MSKTKLSAINSISSVVFTLLNGLFNLIVTRKLIEVYGSDFNGLNSTASQFISVLLIIEGGFAIAANVALFRPLSDGDTERINGILSAVSARFRKIGFLFLIIGTIAAFAFTAAIKSDLSNYVKLGTFIMLVFSTFVSLSLATKYKVLIQSDQREYIINILSIITYFVSYTIMYVGIMNKWAMLSLRAIVMICAIANSCLIALICKKKYRYICTTTTPDYVSIKGTNDVFVQKITGVVYYAAPILAISVFVSTSAASVYAVYNTVLTLIRSLENSMINAPRMSLGRLVAEEGERSNRIKEIFDEYEFILFITISVMLSVAAVMIMPFAKLYAKSFYDISYVNWRMAVILILICFVECIHIPSGNLINMSGHFKAGKNIQLIAGTVLLVGLILGGLIFSIDGVLIAVLITAIVLAILEIGYVQLKIFRSMNAVFLKTIIVNAIASISLILTELSFKIEVTSFLWFFIYAALFAIANSFALLIINYIFNKNLSRKFLKRSLGLLRMASK